MNLIFSIEHTICSYPGTIQCSCRTAEKSTERRVKVELTTLSFAPLPA